MNLKKYKNDKINFAENALCIPNYMTGKTTNSKLFGWQKTILHSDDNLLIDKAGRTGITTAFELDIIYNLIFYNSYNMLYISLNSNSLDTKRDICKIFNYSSIPMSFKINNKNLIKTSNNSMVLFKSGNASSIRGHSFDTVYIDEADNINDFEDLYLSLLPCLSPKNGKIFISFGSAKGILKNLWTARNTFDTLLVNAFGKFAYNNQFNALELTRPMYDAIIKECII